MNPRAILGVSGASGAMLALECARILAGLGVVLDLVLSPMAERTLALEIGPEAQAELEALATRVHNVRDLGAAIASGSCPIAGMIVAPCSMRSLAAIAHGFDDKLLTRAAGVQLKEHRPLVLLTREAPLTLAHLRNMTSVAEMGGIILPPGSCREVGGNLKAA
jgi:4-hydroxy-3-polyprenylbenzoate decarboxylase